MEAIEAIEAVGAVEAVRPSLFKKDILINSKLFSAVQRDLLSVLLEDRYYAVDECMVILENEYKRMVK